ncbi:precorrin-3B C(17)-methyltransferase [Egibacter rhizosphaerae]|uniref:Precorrin-3B C(17)-methyltransferase n=1 Tax=Egibacter rhizosphaerae TaxID=1670831 RepID=A0A411YF47_9ACTN|nr:precorrin-3B C(17)-methyltransferase [Egibacter rhizosphaerae]QBI19816.1 precorrin-3B C(17)-methyltransferase [Egibacter rhizosphaerae]
MRVAILAATDHGARHAGHLAAALPDAHVFAGRLGDRIEQAWRHGDGLVVCGAVGAAVRVIAPLLDDKHTDPAVVVVDDAARHAVVLAGAHRGGNALADRVADALGAQPVVTTATDTLGRASLDGLGTACGGRLDPDVADVAEVTAALLAGTRVARWREQPWPTGPLPGPVTDVPSLEEGDPPLIAVTDRRIAVPRPAVVVRPPSLIVGVGASRGATTAEVAAAIDGALADAGLSSASVASLATVEAKADEPALRAVAEARGWPLELHPAGALARVPVPNPSEEAARAVGTASVAEAAALASAQGTLVVEKRRSAPEAGAAMATVAVARRPARGHLRLVSTGPGDPALVPQMARDALAGAEVVVGLDQYIERVRGWLRPGCVIDATPIGDEVGRADRAIASALEGRVVVLLSGGDVGVYAMASPTLERLASATDLEVDVVPGITSANAAAARLGAPLGHDHCAISLSDLMTPWETIARRLEAAAWGDLTLALYNPRSRDRDWQLPEARRLLLAHRSPDTPVGIVRDVFREPEEVRLTTLGELDPATVDMRTVVVIGSSRSVVVGGRFVTPRGYEPQGDRDDVAAGDGPARADDGPARSPAGRTVHPIETESYRRMREWLDLTHLAPATRAVVERVVHASADPSYVEDLVTDEAALRAGRDALASGASLVVDVRMVAAGLRARLDPIVAIDEAPPTAPEGSTRTAGGMRRALTSAGAGAVVVVGCAPTALFAVIDACREDGLAPSLVIGLPVGFVDAAESKAALRASGLPSCSNHGPKGGSAVAAAACNALADLVEVPHVP